MQLHQGDIEFSGVVSPGLRISTRSGSLVFWREAQYVPCYDVNGLWVTAEWFETLGNKSPYDFEPISDKQNLYTFPEVVELGPARAVVKWRYALCDSTREANIFYGNSWADDYYTIYPDGICVRKLVGWPGDEHKKEGDPLLWETGEIIVINPKGTVSHENLDVNPAVFSDLDGDEYRLTWLKERFGAAGGGREETDAHIGKPLCLAHPSSCHWSEYVITANLTGRPHFFMVFPNNHELFPHAECGAGCESPDHPKIQIWKNFPAWKHWPVFDAEYFKGRTASEADMLATCTHTSITSIDPYMHHNLGKGGPFDEGPYWYPRRPSSWHFLVGTTPASHAYVRSLGRSWLYPAAIGSTKRYQGYNVAERAYEFVGGTDRLDFHVVPAHPLINPVFVVKEWAYPRISIRVNDTRLKEHEYEVSHSDGRLIVWVERTFEREATLELARYAPAD